jgi:hypothetical protein
MVRRRVADAGFSDVEITHLGADKVFVRSMAGSDIVSLLERACEFFNLIFSHWERWKEKTMPFQRGAWVRLYGIPLHAWNEGFFKLRVFDCGRFLRADSYTAKRDRLDFARVLIATESLDVVKREEKLVMDDSVVEGYALGDDACILLEDRVSEASLCDQDEDRCDMEASQQVDKMVEDLADRLAKEEASQKGAVNHDDKGLENPPEFSGPVLSPVVKPGRVRSDSCRDSVDFVAETVAPRQESDEKVRARWNAAKLVGDTKGSGCHRTTSCPPGDRSPAWSGPWSRDWVQKHTHGEAGLIFSSKR